MYRERDKMQNFEKLGQELERMGKSEEIKQLARSEAALKLSRMVDAGAVEKAARTGDNEALKNILAQVLNTEEGKKLADTVGKMLRDK